MALSPRLITLLGGLLGGSCGLAPLLSWRRPNINNTKPTEAKIPAITSPAKPSEALPVPADPVKIAESPRIVTPRIKNPDGNCTFIKIENNEELETLFWETLENSWTGYVAFECDSTGQNLEGKIPNSWIGLFPETLAYVGNKLDDGDKLDISISVKYDGVTFTGDVFINPPIIGQWGEKKVSSEGKTVEIVNVTRPIPSETIYIVFKKN